MGIPVEFAFGFTWIWDDWDDFGTLLVIQTWQPWQNSQPTLRMVCPSQPEIFDVGMVILGYFG